MTKIAFAATSMSMKSCFRPAKMIRSVLRWRCVALRCDAGFTRRANRRKTRDVTYDSGAVHPDGVTRALLSHQHCLRWRVHRRSEAHDGSTLRPHGKLTRTTTQSTTRSERHVAYFTFPSAGPGAARCGAAAAAPSPRCAAPTDSPTRRPATPAAPPPTPATPPRQIGSVTHGVRVSMESLCTTF